MRNAKNKIKQFLCFFFLSRIHRKYKRFQLPFYWTSSSQCCSKLKTIWWFAHFEVLSVWISFCVIFYFDFYSPCFFFFLELLCTIFFLSSRCRCCSLLFVGLPFIVVEFERISFTEKKILFYPETIKLNFSFFSFKNAFSFVLFISAEQYRCTSHGKSHTKLNTKTFGQFFGAFFQTLIFKAEND